MIIPAVLNLIPLASLAAILFLVGYKLAKPALFKQMYALGRRHFVPFMVTIIGIVFTDLLGGYRYRVGCRYHVYSIQQLQETLSSLSQIAMMMPSGIGGDVTFINKASIMRTLSHIPDGSKVIIDASKSVHIDQDVVEIIQEFETNAEYRDIELDLVDFNFADLKDQAKVAQHAITNKKKSSEKMV